MKRYCLTEKHIAAFAKQLKAEERSPGTIEKYLRDIGAFVHWLDGEPASKDMSERWREHLVAMLYAPATINSMLAALNKLFAVLGWNDFQVRALKIQHNAFRDAERELTWAEYYRLVEAARRTDRARLALVMETIGAAGIRISEMRYITVEAAKKGKAVIRMKGKVRTILLPAGLCRKLLAFAEEQKTVSGEIFLTRNGTALSRKQVWKEMKELCRITGIEASKVFPHNLRHLFARTFYEATGDITKLADILGHVNLETTRGYLISTGAEHRALLDSLCLLG